jgi:rubrerythrin
MNSFEYAMKMELDGKNYYEEQATKITEPELRKIFGILADDEEKHYQIFKSFSEGGSPKYEEAFKTSILGTTKNVFQSLRDEQRDNGSYPDDTRKVWAKALEIEEKSEKFYREQAEMAEDEEKKKIWNLIAHEEHKHWVAINYVINFLDRPRQWLEDAEWSNVDEG